MDSGSFAKKSRFNNSYYKSYTGSFKDGVPHGNLGELEIRLTAWPRYHALLGKFSPPPPIAKACIFKRHKVIGKKSLRYQRTVKYEGDFNLGNLDGACSVIIEDKLRHHPEMTSTKTYKTLFQNGLELP